MSPPTFYTLKPPHLIYGRLPCAFTASSSPSLYDSWHSGRATMSGPRSPHPCQPDVCPCCNLSCCALRQAIIYSVACWLKYCNNPRALLRKPVISGAISISPAANARHCADRDSLCEGRYARLCDGTARKPRLLCGQGRRPRRLTDLLCHASTRGFGHSLLTALPRSLSWDMATGMHILYYLWFSFYTGLLTMTVES